MRSDLRSKFTFFFVIRICLVLLVLFFAFLGALYSSKPSPLVDIKKGAISLDVGSTEYKNSKECSECHSKVFRAWENSRHKLSFTNKIFQDGYSVEKKAACKNCHAPISHQKEDGISCLVCHVRGNKIVTANPKANPVFHEFLYKPELNTSVFCASCHQFNFSLVDFKHRPSSSDEPMQNTYQEWLRYQRNGGKNSCQDCHMPQKAHTFDGAHNLKKLRDAVQVKYDIQNGVTVFRIKSKGVGHEYPTGDLFRHITLEVEQDGYYEIVYRIGRSFKVEYNPEKQRLEKRLDKNQSLKPGLEVEIPVKMPGSFAYRLVYHYVSEKDEDRGGLPYDEVVAILKDGYVKLTQ